MGIQVMDAQAFSVPEVTHTAKMNRDAKNGAVNVTGSLLGGQRVEGTRDDHQHGQRQLVRRPRHFRRFVEDAVAKNWRSFRDGGRH